MIFIGNNGSINKLGWDDSECIHNILYALYSPLLTRLQLLYGPYGPYFLDDSSYMERTVHIFWTTAPIYGLYTDHIFRTTAPIWTVRSIIELYYSSYMERMVHT